MKTFYLIMYIVAAVLFALALLMPTPPAGSPFARVNLLAGGLLAWVLVDLVRQWDVVVD